MLNSAIKSFANAAKTDFPAQVQYKLELLGINRDGIDEKSFEKVIIGLDQSSQKLLHIWREDIIKDIEILASTAKQSYTEARQNLIFSLAYSSYFTLIALLYLAANDLLPQDHFVFTQTCADVELEIKRAVSSKLLELSELESSYLAACKYKNDRNAVYNFYYIKLCQSLAADFPGVFAEIKDYMQLILPFSLIQTKGFVQKFIMNYKSETFDLKADGEASDLSYFYQYYMTANSSLKNCSSEQEAELSSTQIFTPKWIVEYLLDNSLGRFWLERNENSSIQSKLKYFVESKKQQSEGNKTMQKLQPQEIKLLDPCVGSGNFLLLAFDIFLEIYQECGYSHKEAAREIVSHNLYGLDIDSRVIAWAKFALKLKAVSCDPDFLQCDIELKIYPIEESNSLSEQELRELSCSADIYNISQYLISTFNDARLFGSLIQVEKRDYADYCQGLDSLAEKLINQSEKNAENKLQVIKKLQNLARQASLLSEKYEIVATNPPYLTRLEGKLKKFVNKYYRDYRRDLFSVYIYRNLLFCQEGGYAAYMTPYVWMFIKSYEKLRRYIITEKSITTLAQLEYSAFDAATVPLCAFVLFNGATEQKGMYFKLTDFTGGMSVQSEKMLQAINSNHCPYFYESSSDDFAQLPSCPIVYWASENIIRAFREGKPMHELVEARQGLASGDNKRFLRLWYEVDYRDINFSAKSVDDFLQSGKLYAPHNKGGNYRQWYGNYDYIIKFDQANYQALSQMGNRLPSRQFYFQEAITWSLITSAGFSIRYRCPGSIHNVAGNSAFTADTELLRYLLALLSTPIANYIFKMLNPTLNLNVGDFKNFPVFIDREHWHKIICLSEECIRIAKADWDSSEKSWDFKYNPLANFPAFKENYLYTLKEEDVKESSPRNLAEAYEEYKFFANNQFQRLKHKQEELNRLFIEIYNLNNELKANVNDKDISLRCVFDTELDLSEEMKANRYVKTRRDLIVDFLSFAVGCMLGRFSLDRPGLQYAGGQFKLSDYEQYIPEADNVLPLCNARDSAYIVHNLEKLLIKLYRAEEVENNLFFIASALNKKASKESSRFYISKYFKDKFYRDHCQRYMAAGSGQLAIYWLFSSGDKDAFKALSYMHRFDESTIKTVLNDYVEKEIKNYESKYKNLQVKLENTEDKRESKFILSEIQETEAKIKETIDYRNKLTILAEESKTIDLDRGVKANHEQVQTNSAGKKIQILADLL